jgi:hypothetical protein
LSEICPTGSFAFADYTPCIIGRDDSIPTFLQTGSSTCPECQRSPGSPAPLRPYAGEVETAVTEGRPEEEIRTAVEQLLTMCDSVRRGTPA